MNKRLVLVIGVVLVVVIAIIASILFLIRRDETLVINIMAVPEDSQITLDGQPISAGQVKLSSGLHTLKATHIYFTDDVQEIDTKNLSENQTIYLLPGADSPEAQQWMIDHPISNELKESVGSYISIERANTIYSRNPEIKQLPYTSVNFKISYDFDTNYNLTYFIDLYPYSPASETKNYDYQLKKFKQEALDFLKNIDVDIDKAVIKFNPEKATDL